MRKYGPTTGALLCSFLFLSCSSHSHTVTTDNGTVTIKQGSNSKDASIHAEGKDGSVDFTASEGGKTVTDYPSDTPLYAAKASMDIKSDQKHSRSLIMQSTDSMDKIADFYKSELASKGWKIETNATIGKMVIYNASKDNRDLVVQISGDDKTTAIQQTVADK